MIEPSWTDAGVALAGTPGIAIGMSRLQFLVSGITGSTIREDDRTRLQVINDAPSLGIVIIGATVYLTFLAGATIPAITAIGSVKPHLKHLTILRHQFLQLTIVIVDILRRAITRLMTVPWREVYSHLNAMALAGLSEIAHHIALAVTPGRGCHTIVGPFAGPQAIAIVMFAGEYHTFHPSLDQRLYPLVTIQSGGVERIGWRIAIAPLLVQECVWPKVDKGISLHPLPCHLLGRWHRQAWCGCLVIIGSCAKAYQHSKCPRPHPPVIEHFHNQLLLSTNFTLSPRVTLCCL